ncbi:hypothetical protein BGZ95_007872, partial [Linnemannia exigua]
MTDNHICLFCLVDGESTSFPVGIEPTTTIGDPKDAIKAKKTNDFSDVDVDKLKLWLVSIPDDDDNEPSVLLDNLLAKKKLSTTNKLFMVFDADLPEGTIHVIVQRPPPGNKKIRIEEDCKHFTASDGVSVDLPPPWIELLANTEFGPETQAAFDHLKGSFGVGDGITLPSMGQLPKEFGRNSQGHNNLFVAEQMLELWEDMLGDKD